MTTEGTFMAYLHTDIHVMSFNGYPSKLINRKYIEFIFHYAIQQYSHLRNVVRAESS
jgi:hypothetical protein